VARTIQRFKAPFNGHGVDMSDTGLSRFPLNNCWRKEFRQIAPHVSWTNRQAATTQQNVYVDWFFAFNVARASRNNQAFSRSPN
jgi:hypothetical protein